MLPLVLVKEFVVEGCGLQNNEQLKRTSQKYNFIVGILIDCFMLSFFIK